MFHDPYDTLRPSTNPQPKIWVGRGTQTPGSGPDLAWWRPRCHCVDGGPHVVRKSRRLANDVGATNGGDDSPSGE